MPLNIAPSDCRIIDHDISKPASPLARRRHSSLHVLFAVEIDETSTRQGVDTEAHCHYELEERDRNSAREVKRQMDSLTKYEKISATVVRAPNGFQN